MRQSRRSVTYACVSSCASPVVSASREISEGTHAVSGWHREVTIWKRSILMKLRKNAFYLTFIQKILCFKISYYLMLDLGNTKDVLSRRLFYKKDKFERFLKKKGLGKFTISNLLEYLG